MTHYVLYPIKCVCEDKNNDKNGNRYNEKINYY